MRFRLAFTSKNLLVSSSSCSFYAFTLLSSGMRLVIIESFCSSMNMGSTWNREYTPFKVTLAILSRDFLECITSMRLI